MPRDQKGVSSTIVEKVAYGPAGTVRVCPVELAGVDGEDLGYVATVDGRQVEAGLVARDGPMFVAFPDGSLTSRGPCCATVGQLLAAVADRIAGEYPGQGASGVLG
jgi:hypothetical protein